MSIADAPQPAQPNRRQRLARRIRIGGARLRPLAWKGVRLTARQFLAGFGYTAGAAAAAELLGHVAVRSSPLMLLWQYLMQ
ncbi:hypothetical protein [Streptomyces lavendulocolor]|uniref:hypothetical protein n=1 Tax=Streptomyces lavendulocolor TaxID=67316 RepID=UPI003C2E7970